MGCLRGETIVFTGKLESMQRSEAEKMAKEHGALTASSITNSTTLLVTGSKTGSKLDKARSMGIKVISEDQWLAKMGKRKEEFMETRSEPEIIADLRDRISALCDD